MNAKHLVRKLIVHAPPPDLLDEIYGRIRQATGTGGDRMGWEQIVGRARAIGIFNSEEVHAFLRFVHGPSSPG